METTAEITREDLVAAREAAGLKVEEIALAMGMHPAKLFRILGYQSFDQEFARSYIATTKRIARERVEALDAW